MGINLKANPEEWLSQEGKLLHKDRISRLKWLIDESPSANYWIFPAGTISAYLFEEARYCYVYGQDLAAILLGISYIEHTLASLFYASGRNDLKRANFELLLKEALKAKYIDSEEYEQLDKVRKIRNPVSHFRTPGHRESIEFKMVNQEKYPYDIIREEARQVLKVVFKILNKNAV